MDKKEQMNILTFDIEEWALAKTGGYGSKEKYAQYDSYLNLILAELDGYGIKATFFCTGAMADEFPSVIKSIQSRGHEIGCHSYRHTWMNKLSETEAREDTHRAVVALEQCIGRKVLSYRAPAFSIGESNKWMFEILAGEGITRDASVFPAARDYGGFPAFESKTPCTINHSGSLIKEYPISMMSFMGRQLAYSGGGYFRFFPLSVIKTIMTKSDYTMCYFHIEDLIQETGGIPSKAFYESYYKEPGKLKNRYVRYIKSNLGKKNAWNKLDKLILSSNFINLEIAESMIDWDTAPVVYL